MINNVLSKYPLPNMKAVTLGIYTNGSYTYNIVSKDNLKDHIEYNLTMRPGRIFYVDGQRLNNGCIKPEYLHKYDKIAKGFFERAVKENFKNKLDTLPYR